MTVPKSHFVITAANRSGPPQCPPNPAYPNGVDVGCAPVGVPSCKAALPYPAPERLVWIVRCKRCGLRAAVTAAGRADDPRSVTMECGRPLQ